MESEASSAVPPRSKKGKKAGVTDRAPKTVWTTEMVSTLLDKRCDDFAASFELHRSAAQLSIIWGEIALAINVQDGTSVPALAVNNKYSNLKREYSTIRLGEQATGNEVDVVSPPYWDDVVTALGNKAGLGHIDYAFDGSGPKETEDDSDSGRSNADGDVSQTSKRQAVVDAEVARQRSKRPKKMDIGQSLVALGESLAQGMKGLQPVVSNEGQEQEKRKLLVAIDKLQLTVEQSTSIQTELLNYLRRND
ncbi:hypothetical protein DYB30_012477 [Aphanomyces astaci]|uniref:Myb/SANT-like domain-containing protein n=1 Tax=Aphanomyces astaci TaxID=112090 RepID=A0A397EBT6_APHAT|nr:hypothetical protein DYB30_012477 [Aphanomyces astaci]